MKKIKIKYYSKVILILVLIIPINSFAWGNKGHAIVSEIASIYLDKNTKNKVISYLNGMTFEEAANWMDDIRDDHTYDYMKPYHYVNFEKGIIVKNNPGNNIISVLAVTINELKKYKNLPKEEVKKKICIIFHLIGDLHQPLHVGYFSDKGGNMLQINFNGNGTNLHSLYDSEIIKYKRITLQDCINANKLNSTQIKDIQKGEVVDWAKQSRSNLDEIYNFDGHKTTEDYINNNADIIRSQLFKAGLRLASVLNDIFKN